MAETTRKPAFPSHPQSVEKGLGQQFKRKQTQRLRDDYKLGSRKSREPGYIGEDRKRSRRRRRASCCYRTPISTVSGVLFMLARVSPARTERRVSTSHPVGSGWPQTTLGISTGLQPKHQPPSLPPPPPSLSPALPLSPFP